MFYERESDFFTVVKYSWSLIRRLYSRLLSLGRSSRTGKRHDMIPKEDDIGLNERAVAFSARDVQKVYTFSFEQVIPILLAPLPKNEEKQMTNGRYIL